MDVDKFIETALTIFDDKVEDMVKNNPNLARVKEDLVINKLCKHFFVVGMIYATKMLDKEKI